ncbi:MAG: hypothetical protein WC389_17315 [Lutibacter sp.]|jgi:hypothetical protein
MGENIKKRFVTDDEIAECGMPQGWAFHDVEVLLEKEHHQTVVELLNWLVKDGILLYNEARIVARYWDIDWDELERI